MSALVVAAAVAVAACLVTWLASLLTGEHSWVDRLWSIVPNVMAALVTLWGARLTFNSPGRADTAVWRTIGGQCAGSG